MAVRLHAGTMVRRELFSQAARHLRYLRLLPLITGSVDLAITRCNMSRCYIKLPNPAVFSTQAPNPLRELRDDRWTVSLNLHSICTCELHRRIEESLDL